MWPLDLGRRGDVLRIGAHAVELWRGSSSALERVACEPLERRGSLYEAGMLAGPLHALAGRVERGRASVVLESAFAPALLADTGGVLTNRPQLQALLRHRFGLAYGGPGVDIASWKLRTDHRFGDRYALGYALPPAVELVLAEAAQSTKLVFTGWHPALAWGLDRFTPARRWPKRLGWWVWPEQDRSLVVRLVGGRAKALNPASLRCATAAEIQRSIAIEGVRFGLDPETCPIGVGHWQSHESPMGHDIRVQRFAVAAGVPAPGHTSAPGVRDAHAAAR